MKELILPYIVTIGIYNAQQAVKNREITKNRKTTMFELELPIGNGGISFIDEDSAVITENMMICAKPGQIRHTRLPFKCYFVHMIVTEGELYDRLMDIPSYINIENRELYESIFKQLCNCYDSALEQDTLLIQSKILELIYLLCDHKSERGFRCRENNKEMIEKAIHYIKNNLTADLSLNALAEYTSFSPIHFHNCFKRSTGSTLRDYVEEQRIRKATTLLISTDLTLSDIAYECGFSSQSYFSYAFNKRMKKTPREYAKEVYRRYEE